MPFHRPPIDRRYEMGTEEPRQRASRHRGSPSESALLLAHQAATSEKVPLETLRPLPLPLTVTPVAVGAIPSSLYT